MVWVKLTIALDDVGSRAQLSRVPSKDEWLTYEGNEFYVYRITHIVDSYNTPDSPVAYVRIEPLY